MTKKRLYFFENEKGERMFESNDYYEVKHELHWFYFHVFHEKYLPKIKYIYEEN